MKRIDELTEPPIVGKYYLVPCVQRLNFSFSKEYWPILTNAHQDIELGIKWVHYHYDHRFISDRLFNSFHYTRTAKTALLIEVKGQELVYKKRKCVITHQPFLMPDNIDEETKLLYATMENKYKCITNGKCPHKGTDLISTPVVNGIIECPAHGLRFDAITGKLIPRYNAIRSL